MVAVFNNILQNINIDTIKRNMMFFGVKRVFNFSDFITKFYSFYSVLKSVSWS